MKKITFAAAFLALSVSLLSGCSQSAPAAPSTSADASSGSSASASASSAAPASGEAKKIGIVQIVEHTSLNQIRESFMAEMTALGYGEDKAVIEYANASGDQSNLNSICQKFAGDRKDLIIAIATPSAQSAAAAAPNIPLIFSAVTDPVAAKLVTNPAAPEGNISGTSDAIPVDQVFSLMKQLTPDVKTIGMVYNLGEVNSVSVIEQAKQYCDANGLKYVEATVTNSSEVQQAAQSLVGKCEAFYTPIDNTVASAMAAYAEVARQAKLPIYTGADSMVIDGGFATVGIDYTLLGKQTAQMAIKALEGTPMKDLPVETLSNFSTILNKTTAEMIGVTIPETLASTAQIVE